MMTLSDSLERLDQIVQISAKATSIDALEGCLKNNVDGVLLGIGVQWWRVSPRNTIADWSVASGDVADDIGAGLTVEGETWASLTPKAWRRERSPEVLGVSVPVVGRMHTFGALSAHLLLDHAQWTSQQNAWLGRLLLLAQLVQDRVERWNADSSVTKLAPREIECLSFAAEGLKAKQIAEELGIGQQTVQFHLARARLKLSASNTVQAVVRAAKLGLLRTGR